jgi:hypothetical protein
MFESIESVLKLKGNDLNVLVKEGEPTHWARILLNFNKIQRDMVLADLNSESKDTLKLAFKTMLQSDKQPELDDSFSHVIELANDLKGEGMIDVEDASAPKEMLSQDDIDALVGFI